MLAIRRNDYQGFLDYRNTIRAIIADHLQSGGTVSEADARQIYLDVLRPRLEGLANQIAKQRRQNRKSALVSLGVPAALLSIGIVGGVLPVEVSNLLKIGGTLGLINEGLKGLLTAPMPTRSNSLYFLLELEKASINQ